ncbi:MAG TPA: ComEA family DNA-binding protein [Anaerolineales bacterium]|nr:ComEA family DNA-binding protein [Anaerolineales bacterium]
MKTFLITILGILIGLFLAAAIWNTARQPRGVPVELRPPPTHIPISVYVTGSVVAPGIYALPEGSRMADAINAAGGFLPIADQEQINLAALVRDGEKIIVGTRSNYGASSESSDRININTATLEELETLPGIGPSTAQRIIDHRQANGKFERIDQITEVSGIGPATYDRIKDLITVD